METRPAFAIFIALSTLTTLMPVTSWADLTHRWSFSNAAGAASAGTVVLDEVTAAEAVVRGGGGTFTGSGISVPGATNNGVSDATISAYVDLPNGIISSKTDLTVEVWAAPIDARNWQHLFEFGRMNNAGDGAGAVGEWTGTTGGTPGGGTISGDALLLTLCRGTNLDRQRMSMRHDGSDEEQIDAELSTTVNQLYHYVLTFEDGVGAFGAGGGRMTWYRDGVPAGTGDVSFHLSDLQDVNNWLGRNQWSNLSTTNARYDEFRLYDHAFDAAEVIASRDAGPDAGFGPPELQGDTLTIHDGQKIRGFVLANDTGAIDSSTVEIVTAPAVGTASPQPDGRILYSHNGGGAGNDTFNYRVTGAGGISESATVTVEIAASLRIANSEIDIPAEAPSLTIEVVPAFPGVTVSQPTDVASAPGDTNRLWITQRNGIVRMIPDVTSPAPARETFFDLPALLASRGEAMGNPGNERGLLGMVFHPDYQSNGYFYLFYSVNIDDTNYNRLSRFSVDATDPDVADPTTELVLIEQVSEFGLHLGGDLQFGTDGYLYFSSGDEGGQFDGSSRGQEIDGDLYAGIMRIDVDKLPGNPEPHAHPAIPTDAGLARFSIPADNPFVTVDPTISYNGQDLPSGDVRTEYWANGFRNPWRFHIDQVTGEVWCADVGQNAWEEINLVTAGGNYGWSFREGLHDGPNVGSTPAGWTGVDPIYEYGHGGGEFQGRSITGGLVYRGTEFPELVGSYLFADYVSGNIWALSRPGGEVVVERIAGEAGLSGFGADPSNGEVLMVDYGGNRLMRLTTGGDEAGNFPQTLSETGLFSDLTDLSPAPGLLPYEPNLRFWSDFADKTRWFMIPDGASEMTWSEDGAWTYPEGMLWVKHFDLELERGNPATAKRIETRVLVKTADGSYGVSYRWNDEETEATLVSDAGDDFEIEVVEEGMPRMQQYLIPSRAECLACHTPQAGHALSFNTRQLNQDFSIHGFSGNQIDTLAAQGFFDNTPSPSVDLPYHVSPDDPDATLEEKVRSYLAVNCSNCHMAGGTVEGSWDARAHLTLLETGLIDGDATNNGGDPANKLIVPGDTGHSIVLNRLGETNGFSRMPPIGSTEHDQEGIDLLTAWINQLDGPDVPMNLSATDASSSSEVGLAWDAVSGATSYDVYRSLSDSFGSAALLLNLAGAMHDDANAVPGFTYFYWVVARNDSGMSQESASFSGSRALAPPTALVASDGTDLTQVALTWAGNPDATSYEIFRNTVDDILSANEIGNTGSIFFNDPSTDPGIPFFYWVRSTNAHTESVFTASDQGARGLVVANLSADLAIGDSFGRVNGLGIVNLSGSGQVAKIRTKGKTAKEYSIVKNTGNVPSAIRISGKKSDSKWTLKYYLVSGGRINVTGAVISGSHATAMVAAGGETRYEIRAVVKSKIRNRRSKLKAWFSGSPAAGGTGDRVIGKIEHRP